MANDIVPAAEALIDVKFPVLDHGFVMLDSYMGSDKAIVRAARNCTSGENTKTVLEDEGLLRHLVRSVHTSPLEFVEFRFLCRMPIFVARQWIRHRTACLAGNVPISFDLPGRLDTGKRRHYALTVKQIYDRWQPTQNTQRPDRQRNPLYRREQVQQMHLRSVNEDSGEVYATNLTNIVLSGTKEVLSAHFDDGSWLRATANHMCLTSLGWLPLKEGLVLRAAFAGVGKREAIQRSVEPFADDELAAEEWRNIPGFPECYEVSDLGRVRNWNNTRGERLSSPTIKEATLVDGYPSVSLSWSGKSRLFRVHKLVLQAFVGIAGDDEEARHLDGCRANLRLCNLAWGTSQENADDRMEQGGDQRLVRKWVNIVSWESDGEEDVYDLSVVGPYHNFIAGGVVVHNSVNEMSGRFGELPELVYVPDVEQIAYQSPTSKQGRGSLASREVAETFRISIEMNGKSAFDDYHTFLGKNDFSETTNFSADEYAEIKESGGISRELARIDLPLNTYTQWAWKIDLHNLLHFLWLRLDEHAQWEIRQYAQIMAKAVEAVCPLTWKAFVDYRLEAMTLSGPEIEAIRVALLNYGIKSSEVVVPNSGTLSPAEMKALTAKLKRLCILQD